MAKETPKTLVLEIVVRKVDYEGKQFNAYHTFTNKNERLDVRFVKDAFEKAPKETGTCFIEVATDQMNISKKYRYPRLYIQDIIGVVDRPERPVEDLPF